MPLFSIVVPTLQRSDTLRHTLATLIDQTLSDFEIVVQNNGGDARTEAVVGELNDVRIRHFASPSVLPMVDNWEAALRNARGKFITFVGDDDGFFPDACHVAADILQRTRVDALTWHPFCYYWPNFVYPNLCNRLVAAVDYDFRVHIVSAETELQRFYRFAIGYWDLPMVYNSFVHRSVIERSAAKIGRYFVGLSPDLTSGIINAAYISDFARISRPLSVSGLSHHSLGSRVLWLGRSAISGDEFERYYGAMRQDERLVPTENFQITIANDMLLVRDRLLAEGRAIPFEFRGLIESAAAAINTGAAGSYSRTLAAIRELAERCGVDLSEISIPEKEEPTLECGATPLGPNQIKFVIDGNRAHIRTISDAVRLLWQLVPRFEPGDPIGMGHALTSGRPTVPNGQAVRFCAAGDGLSALFEGWGQPEEWGTWSVAKRALLRLRVDGQRPLDATIRYRPFLHGEHRRLDIVCCARERKIDEWTCTQAGSAIRSVAIPGDAINVDGTLDLEFLILNPQSPAKLGNSNDTRLLGMGLEELTVRATGAQSTA